MLQYQCVHRHTNNTLEFCVIHEPVILPLLSDEELHQVFSDDAAALRRYNMLAAVVHGGASADESAACHGSSPRTVRHLLQRYRQQPGLDTLRSQQPGPRGHLRSESSVAQVVAEVYADAPQASGGALLVMANRRLAHANQRLSRATFYRLLAALREDPQTSERADQRAPLRGALNTALTLLTEDPPISLGNSLLARMSTPPLPEGMPLERGKSLAKIITTLILDMQPALDTPSGDPRARAYAILASEFLSGDDPQDVQERLAISPRTYYRAKRQALDRLVDLLPAALASLTPPLPRLADPIPAVELFVGRDDEVSYYQWRLRQDNMVVIWGLAGSGKTALAAKLAAEGQRLGQAVVWHTVSAEPGSPVRDTLSALAGGLLDLGGPGVVDAVRHWQQEAAGLAQDQQIVRLVALLARRHCVVMLDNARRTDTEPSWDFLLSELRRQATAGQLRLVVLSRALPDWARGGGWPALEGLDERATQKLLQASGLDWDEATCKAVYDHTNGHPQVLRLVTAWAKAPSVQGHDLTALLDHADIRAYLLSEMCYALSEGASRMLRWVCALRRPLDLSETVGQAALAEAGNRRQGAEALELLQSRGLLVQSTHQVFQPPALVREHIAQQGRADRAAWRRLHRRIARAYTSSGEIAEAAHHAALGE